MPLYCSCSGHAGLPGQTGLGLGEGKADVTARAKLSEFLLCLLPVMFQHTANFPVLPSAFPGSHGNEEKASFPQTRAMEGESVCTCLKGFLNPRPSRLKMQLSSQGHCLSFTSPLKRDFALPCPPLHQEPREGVWLWGGTSLQVQLTARIPQAAAHRPHPTLNPNNQNSERQVQELAREILELQLS